MENNHIEIINKPTPIDKEVLWDKTKTIITKTDASGIIETTNDVFTTVSGYTQKEIISQPHSIIRHPDMPKIIYKLLWDQLEKEEPFFGIVKNLAKSGEYYWLQIHIETIKNKSGKVTHYSAKKIAVSQEVITNEIEPLYKRLAKLEEFYGIENSENYLNGFLQKENKSYAEYIDSCIEKYPNNYSFNQNQELPEEETRGFFKRLFR
ncbi:PAS domain-containing protein [Flavobacterium sp. P4023]|uniref:PAS domain-containing protein n=1 Tax=Flavobacterium flabelliforme TaxID=2816119 RepID=A0ABS5CR96_9FLAO|nr:PAS domain-containing protein [Flavobacterium flabelliforme]MBP4141151.1 PAS domain-containing protein [Flavobacterium flabelliforme]